MVFLSILTGLLGLFNYYSQANAMFPFILSLLGQIMIFLLALFARIAFKGRRKKNGYEGYNIWTFPYAITILSLFGNGAILVVFILHQLGYLTHF